MVELRWGIALGVVVLALAVTGCTSKTPLTSTRADPETGPPGAAQAAYGRFTDVPIPEGAEMDLERSLILGSGDDWLGRVVLGTGASVPELFDFYRREMPKFGWSEVTVVRAQVSVLTYLRGARVATVRIQPSSLGNSVLDLTVSPRGGPASVPQ